MKKILLIVIIGLTLNGCSYGYNTLKDGVHEDIKKLEQELHAQIDEISKNLNNKICELK